MVSVEATGFDKIASQYDVLWSHTAVGKAQRLSVWRHVDRLFRTGDFVLDLGCGTGVDALHFQSRGGSVYGIDSSPEMVEIARSRGIKADCCRIEDIQDLELRVDGVISNFGALNCLTSLGCVADSLGKMVRSGGYVALCFLSRFCLWEVAYYLLCAKPGKAFRRFRGSAGSLLGKVFYPSSAEITSAFKRDFRLTESYGIGLCVPPSYVTFLSAWELEQLSRIERRLSDKPILRALADHRLYIFERI